MEYQFGEKLRFIREKKGKTLKVVASEAGVSESLISQIERNKVSPAVDTLLKIAECLKIDFEYLFEDYKRKKNVNLVKKEKRKKITLDGIIYEQLSKTVENTDHEIEAYYIELKPGSSRGSVEYGHPGKELGIILSGEGSLQIGSEIYKLYEGDSISLGSDVPHSLINTGNSILKAYWMVTPPKILF